MSLVVTNSKQDFLFDLIKSLSKAEKRNFKLFATRQAGNADAKFISLFDVMDSLSEYDEAKILKRSTIKKGQLPNAKAHLYRQILVASRHIRVQHNVSMELTEQIDFARILYDKGLYKQSLKILAKAKKSAVYIGELTTALKIVEFEKSIELLNVTNSTSTRAESLSIQTTRLCNLIDSTNRLSNLSIQLYSLYLKLGYVRSQRDLDLVEKFFVPKINSYTDNKLSFLEKLHLYQAKMWYGYIRYDFKASYRYSSKVVQLFSERKEMRPILYDQYLKSYSRFLESLFLIGDYPRLKSALETYEGVANEIAAENDHAYILSRLSLFYNKINIAFMEGNFSGSLYLVDEVEEFLKGYGLLVDTHYKMLLYYKLACLNFGCQRFVESIHYLQHIIKSKDNTIRRDLQCFARILNLIASYESGQDYNLEYQIRNVYSYIVKMNDMHIAQKEVINFLKRLNSIYASDIRAELNTLYSRLQELSSHPYERRPFLYLDIISWLESKLQGVSVEQVIQAKFERSQNSRLKA